MSNIKKEATRTNNRFFHFLKYGSISTLALIPTLMAGIIVAIFVVIKANFSPALPKILNAVVIFLASLLIGSVGAIYIYRKEMPGPISSTTVKGAFAIFSGWLLIIFFWGLGLLALLLS
jgi:hypothetical protein